MNYLFVYISKNKGVLDPNVITYFCEQGFEINSRFAIDSKGTKTYSVLQYYCENNMSFDINKQKFLMGLLMNGADVRDVNLDNAQCRLTLRQYLFEEQLVKAKFLKFEDRCSKCQNYSMIPQTIKAYINSKY